MTRWWRRNHFTDAYTKSFAGSALDQPLFPNQQAVSLQIWFRRIRKETSSSGWPDILRTLPNLIREKVEGLKGPREGRRLLKHDLRRIIKLYYAFIGYHGIIAARLSLMSKPVRRLLHPLGSILSTDHILAHGKVGYVRIAIAIHSNKQWDLRPYVCAHKSSKVFRAKGLESVWHI